MEVVFHDINVSKLYYFPTIKYLHLKLKGDVDYSLKSVEEDFLFINNLKKNEKIFVLLDLTDISFEHIPKEVMQYMANSPYKQNHIKIALISTGLAQKIFGNLYLKIFKPETRTQIHSSLKEAFEWFEFYDLETKLARVEDALQHID